MKVQLNDDGSMEFDVQCEDDIILLKKITEKKDEKQIRKDDLNAVGAMNKWEYETYCYLVDHDCEEGVAIDAMHRALDITNGAAYTRCATLVKRGHAKRVGRGRYKAI